MLSHGHNDHTGGLTSLVEQVHLQDVTLIAHPLCFEKKRFEQDDIGSSLSAENLSQKCHLYLTKDPYWITDRLVFLGEIPSFYPFEKRKKLALLTNKEVGWMI